MQRWAPSSLVAQSLLVAMLEAVFLVISIFAGGCDATYLRSDVTRCSIGVTHAFLIAGLIVGAVGVALVLRLVHKQIR
jgi:mannose/fructose/N-acetylgalactosamine-specific phosphotransferase system component IIC